MLHSAKSLKHFETILWALREHCIGDAQRSELNAQIRFYSRVPIDSRCRRGGVGGTYVLRRGR